MIILTRPFFIFDLETTSLKVQEARIWEVAFKRYEHTFPSTPTKEWELQINPRVQVPDDICQTCHITNEELASKPTFDQVAPHLAKGFVNCDFGGKNTRYDLQVMFFEMQREGIDWSYAGARIIDADRLEQIGEPRTLSHLYKKHTGRTLEGAHRAIVDVGATEEVIAAQLRTYQHIPRDIDHLHEEQWPGWIDSEGKFRFNKQGVPICMFGKYSGQALQNIPPDYWNWIVKSDFSAEIKQLAAKALKGEYPHGRHHQENRA
jgi:DNA polymerase-3 subunit epsilon